MIWQMTYTHKLPKLCSATFRNVKGFVKLCIPNTIKVALVNCHWLLGTYHFHISHNTPYLPAKILYILCFQFLLGITVVPGEIEDNAYATFWGKNNLGAVQMANCTFGHTELTSKIYLSDDQIIASQWAISQCPKQPLLHQVYFVVHFYSWYISLSHISLCFNLLIIH